MKTFIRICSGSLLILFGICGLLWMIVTYAQSIEYSIGSEYVLITYTALAFCFLIGLGIQTIFFPVALFEKRN
tara:strand:- start:132 stop:350 length:219 start_codon:yes stop_codon:yes gene_type:complete